MKYKKYILPIVLGLVFLISRLINLDKSPIWEDNFSWLYRINYYPWIIETNFKGNPEPGKGLDYAGNLSYHPGATVMTFSGIFTRLGKKFLTTRDLLYKPCGYNDIKCTYLTQELFMAKLPLLVIDTILFMCCVYLIDKHFGLISSIIFGVLLLCEPIFFQTSRDLHLDFLQAILITSVFLFILNKNTKVSAFLYGLTLLTRFSSIFFFPELLVVLYVVNKSFKNIAIFCALATLCFFALYPPMWVAPIKTLRYIANGSSSSSHEVKPLSNPLFSYLNGFSIYTSQSTNKVNGVSVIWIVLFLLTLPVGVLMKPTRQTFLVLLLYTSYLLFLNISEKRYFRYLTPIIMGYTIYIGAILDTIGRKSTTIKQVLEKSGLSS